MAGSATILFIEDDHFISEMYCRSLRQAGYTVDEAATGPKGIAAAREGKYDLILLDIFIPEKTGIEVLHELREDDGSGLPETKIVIMTNYSQDNQSRQALSSQADGYFIKAEVTPRKLVQLVEKLLGPTEAEKTQPA